MDSLPELLAGFPLTSGLAVFFASMESWQIAAIFLCFVWSGFIRGALSFGGAALSLPILLIVYPEPLFFLPIIAIHLLFFGFFSVYNRLGRVDWKYLRRLLLLLFPTKVIGVIGLLQLPAEALVIIIYGFSLLYAVNYLCIQDFVQRSGTATRMTETVMLMLGGYMSGTALSGAPLIVAVAGRYVARYRLRATLFMLWTMLVTIKLAAMEYAGFSWHLVHHLWLLPAAILGNFFGVMAHGYIQKLSDTHYYKLLGAVLGVLGIVGLADVLGGL